jgi:alpha-L-fucosidase
VNRRSFLLDVTGAFGFTGVSRAFGDSDFFGGEIPKGPFLPFWESLKSYRCPDWFGDAKFGIWAHWTPQCVPEQGDWYARNMSIQRAGAIRVSREALRPSIAVWIQRHLPSLEG